MAIENPLYMEVLMGMSSTIVECSRIFMDFPYQKCWSITSGMSSSDIKFLLVKLIQASHFDCQSKLLVYSAKSKGRKRKNKLSDQLLHFYFMAIATTNTKLSKLKRLWERSIQPSSKPSWLIRCSTSAQWPPVAWILKPDLRVERTEQTLFRRTKILKVWKFAMDLIGSGSTLRRKTASLEKLCYPKIFVQCQIDGHSGIFWRPKHSKLFRIQSKPSLASEESMFFPPPNH